ncbi:MAG TPA: DUF1570 domain-containing protein, partial [Planctomycetota bacterium]|nr:DUF1570 domain-containing protein [Planctomycetota bacterium]
MLQPSSRLVLACLLAVPVLALAPRSVHPQERVTFGDDPEADAEEAPEAPKPLAAPIPEAIREAVLALETAPADSAHLQAAAQAALQADLRDEALWYANLALEALGEDIKLRKEREALVALRTEIGVPGPTPEDLQADFSRSLFDMAKACEKKKLYTNAADLLQLCYGTSMEARAEERLAKLFSKEAAVEGLLETGIPIDIPVRRKVNAKTKRLVDSRNTTWDTAYEIKGKFYTVKSDMGYDYTHAFLEVMDQINGFYREVFGYKTRGGDMRTCAINVYKSREEFDEFEKKNRGQAINPNVRGFFVPGENRVATYDPRGEGGTIGDLWSTLFHESSHQFTAAVAPGLLLTWLNEGTASYFEGAFLQPGGSVATNRVPESRLRGLKYSLDALNKGKSAPTLTQVVTWYKPGSYEGEYYPYGWGLVYFMHNFEDEHSERVYLPVYKEFLASYKSASQHDVLARFTEYFVGKAKLPGVETFEQFDALWQAWIQELYKIYFGGPEQVEVLMARAEKQLANKKPEYARESLEWAVEKDPTHLGARLKLAEVLTDLKKLDGAVYHWRQLEAAARAQADA